MLTVSQFTCVRKEGIYIVTGMEDVPCPSCGGKLSVHGTCKRNLKTTGGNVILRLRVMECSGCRSTHRELPNGIVPYKRYSAGMLCAIYTGTIPEEDNMEDVSIEASISAKQRKDECDSYICEPSIRKRIIEWLSWFLAYAQSLDEIEFSDNDLPESIYSRLKYFVCAIANSGKWIQHRFAVSTA